MEVRHIITIVFLNFAFLFMLAFEHVFVREASAMKNLAYTAFWISTQIAIFGGAYLLDRRARARVSLK